MALPSSLSQRFILPTPKSPTCAGHPNFLELHRPTRAGQLPPLRLSLNLNRSRYRSRRRRIHHLPINAVEEGQEENLKNSSSTDKESDTEQTLESSTELGSEIKEAMKERRKEREGDDKVGDLWSGVAEEIKEIEWPAFGKVLGITGVVLGVIAGSSVVLLTVNAVLAELSDRVFVGKGVQDFFG